MKYYFKKYDLSNIDFEEIQEKVNARIDANKSIGFGERLNLTNIEGYGGSQCAFGYAGEEIINDLDKEIILSRDPGCKYDYTKWERFIDLKTMRTDKSLEEIIKKRYQAYLLAGQVDGAKMYCDEHSIEYHDFCFEIVYWDGGSETLVRAFNNGLRLSEILKITPVPGKPYGTNGTDELPWQYVVKMVGSKEDNIIL